MYYYIVVFFVLKIAITMILTRIIIKRGKQ